MNIHKRIENENRHNMKKIIIPLVIMAAAGFFLQVLLREGFFIGWEIYFVTGCYFSILAALLLLDIGIVKRMYYSLNIEDSKLKIRDGFFSRAIVIPVDRIYYVSSIGGSKGIHYDSIFVIDKKINHRKIKPLNLEDIKDNEKVLEVFQDLKDRYPEKNFYYYKVSHNTYKFLYYFYILYKSCERCKFSDTSMGIVKRYVEGR